MVEQAVKVEEPRMSLDMQYRLQRIKTQGVFNQALSGQEIPVEGRLRNIFRLIFETYKFSKLSSRFNSKSINDYQTPGPTERELSGIIGKIREGDYQHAKAYVGGHHFVTMIRGEKSPDFKEYLRRAKAFTSSIPDRNLGGDYTLNPEIDHQMIDELEEWDWDQRIHSLM